MPADEGPRPLIIWVHGGGWQAGSKDGLNPALPLLSKGFAVATINYRLSQQAPFPAQILDCKAAVRFLRSHAAEYRLDPDRFGAFGASAGGHLVALLGTSAGVKELEADAGPNPVSSRVQAVCDWFGPSHFPSMIEGVDEATQKRLREIMRALFGGFPEEKVDLAKLASPITHITADDAPILIIHGDKDPLVPLHQSQRLHEALTKAGVKSTLYVVEGGGHGPGFQKPEIAKMIEEFFTRTLAETK